MRIAITADLHYGHNQAGDDATQQMLQHLQTQPPDLLLLGGDIGTSDLFAECLKLFADLPCRKALIPGNHDLWVNNDDPRGDSLHVYQHHLPALCHAFEYHYLDREPLVFQDANLGVVGSINWYDYSWSLDRMKAEVPDWEWHLQRKAFSRGRHNDARFVRWPYNDVTFTQHVVATMEKQLHETLRQVERVLVITHHPACRNLGFPHLEPVHGLDGLLWQALSGNRALETVLEKYLDRVAMIFSGHTHRAVQTQLGSCPAYNIGGDYHFKRLLMMDWPAGTVQPIVFGDPEMKRRK